MDYKKKLQGNYFRAIYKMYNESWEMYKECWSSKAAELQAAADRKDEKAPTKL